MKTILNYRQGLLKSEIVSSKMCHIVIGELDGKGNLVGEIEIFNNSPENLIDLGKDLIVAALDLQQQLDQEDPPTGFLVNEPRSKENSHGYIYKSIFG